MLVELDTVIQDVADILNWGDGAGCVNPDNKKKIIKGLRRLFDRFSIDSRKLPVLHRLEFCLDRCSNRYAIGPSGDLCAWAVPHTIYYAAWVHKPECGCETNICCDDHRGSVSGDYFLGDQKIRVNNQAAEFLRDAPDRENYTALPSEMWFQQSAPNGEIVFDSIPPKGSNLLIRATMPFDGDLLEQACCPKKPCKNPEWEFEVFTCGSPVSRETMDDIVHEARHCFDGCEDWCLKTKAMTCGPCPVEIEATVTANRIPQIHAHSINAGCLELPQGYYSAIVAILAYDMAPFAHVKRTPAVITDRALAVNLLHRDNERQIAQDEELDLTVPWNNKSVVHDPWYG